MVKKPPPGIKPPVPKIPSPGTNSKPANYLRGSKTIGQKYTAYDNYGQAKPDFGKGNGPGTPYHEVQKIVQKAVPGAGKPVTPGPPSSGIKLPKWAGRGLPTKPSGTLAKDARVAAIRNRLRGGGKKVTY
jgi:hypothetical protein